MQGVLAAVVAAAVLGIINAVLRSFFPLLTLPINILKLGLFTFILNGCMLYFTVVLVRGFAVHGFFAAVFGALVLSIVSGLTTLFLSDEGRIHGWGFAIMHRYDVLPAATADSEEDRLPQSQFRFRLIYSRALVEFCFAVWYDDCAGNDFWHRLYHSTSPG